MLRKRLRYFASLMLCFVSAPAPGGSAGAEVLDARIDRQGVQVVSR